MRLVSLLLLSLVALASAGAAEPEDPELTEEFPEEFTEEEGDEEEASEEDEAPPEKAEPEAKAPAPGQDAAAGEDAAGEAPKDAKAEGGKPEDGKAEDGKQEGATADASAEPPAEPSVSYADAYATFQSGKYAKAVSELFSFIMTSPKTDEHRPWAQLYFARALMKLGLTHAAVVTLTDIAHERADPMVLAPALGDLREAARRPHDEYLVEQVFGSMDVAAVPGEVREYAMLKQGLSDLRFGFVQWTKSSFKALSEGSDSQGRARYAVMVAQLRDTKKVSERVLQGFASIANDEKVPLDVRADAQLAVARLRFEESDFLNALEAYAKVPVPELTPGDASLYLEEAWSKYRVGKLQEALSTLVALDAPAFEGEFIPDKHLLRAFIYRDLCYFPMAKDAADAIVKDYAASLTAIKSRTKLSDDPRLRRAATARGVAKRLADYFQAVSREEALVAKLGPSLGAAFEFLQTLYSLARASAEHRFHSRLDEAVRDEADRLLRAVDQARVMQYEVALKVNERLTGPLEPPPPAPPAPLSDSQVRYEFQNEFWNDELRDYKVTLPTQCPMGVKP